MRTVIADKYDFIEYPKILSQPEADPEALVQEALEQFLSRNDVKGAKVANASSRGALYYGVPLPTREQLGIPKKDRGGKKAGYYPVILEYGTSRMAARPWMRPAIDDTADSEKAQIGRDIGKGIERLARKK